MNIAKLSSFVVAGLVGTALVAKADIIVNWEGLNGFVRSDDVTGLTQPANGSQTAYAQLIFTPFDSYGVAYPGGDVENFELVLDTFVITDQGGSEQFGALATQSYVGPFNNGYIYARIFDQGTGLDPANTITLGTWYYNGTRQQTINNSDITSPNLYNVNGANVSVNYGFGDTLNVQVVPEPATLALLGLGGGLLFLNRRRKA